MNNDTFKNLLGCCWCFPPSFNAKTGVKLAEGTESVLQSLRVLFMTETNERVMRETWGAGLSDFIFENISEELLGKIQSRIEESILRYEKRIILKDIIIQPSIEESSRLKISVSLSFSGNDITESIEGTLELNEGNALRFL
jgi:phage baseplate assembly protein W